MSIKWDTQRVRNAMYTLPLWPSLTLSNPLWTSLTLCDPLWTSLTAFKINTVKDPTGISYKMIKIKRENSNPISGPSLNTWTLDDTIFFFSRNTVFWNMSLKSLFSKADLLSLSRIRWERRRRRHLNSSGCWHWQKADSCCCLHLQKMKIGTRWHTGGELHQSERRDVDVGFLRKRSGIFSVRFSQGWEFALSLCRTLLFC